MKYLRATKNGTEYRIGLEDQPFQHIQTLANPKLLWWDYDQGLTSDGYFTSGMYTRTIHLRDSENFSKSWYTVLLYSDIVEYTGLFEAELQISSSEKKYDELLITEITEGDFRLNFVFHFYLDSPIDDFNFKIKLTANGTIYDCSAYLYKGYVPIEDYRKRAMKLTKGNDVYYAKLFYFPMPSANSTIDEGISVKGNNQTDRYFFKNDLKLYTFTELTQTYDQLNKTFHY